MAAGIRRGVWCVAWCLLAGCATDDLMLKRQTETEARVEHLLQSNRMLEQRMNAMLDQCHAQEEQLKDVVTRLRQLQTAAGELRTLHDALAARVGRLASPRIEAVNPEPRTTQKEYGPPPEYVKAFGLYSANNFSAAIEAFGQFVKTSPESAYVANALYWIGECHYSLSDFDMARETFRNLAETYPKSPKAPDALLKLGYSLDAMKEHARATEVFENLVRNYPASQAAVKARERLTAN